MSNILTECVTTFALILREQQQELLHESCVMCASDRQYIKQPCYQKLEKGWNCTILEDVDSHHPLLYWSTKLQSNLTYMGLLDSSYSICYSHQPNFSWCYAMRSLQIDASVNQQHPSKKKKKIINFIATTFLIKNYFHHQ